uniref:Lamin tail domain containing 1 n=2 Tax=Propithecus coquereli TaxID=379532 RepID=A0A2K6EHU0_PROCO
MKDTQDIQEASKALQSEVHKQEDEVEKQEQSGDKSGVSLVIQRSSVHFFPQTSSDSTALTFSQLSSDERPLSYYPSQLSGGTVSTTGPLTSKGTTHIYYSVLRVSQRHSYLKAPYNLCVLFSSSLGDIKIADVNIKGLFVKLVNSSLDKELAIGDHILQQNVNGQRVSLYRFLPNIVMQANSSVTVWAAASEAKHQPPSNFLWKEQNKFITSPDCTTILCKPNGQAVAWYTLIHWKQAWEKLETDIEFDRSSIVTPKFRRHMFRWAASTTTVTTETEDQPKKGTSKYQLEQDQVFLEREKEIPPTLSPNCSPWCQSPFVPTHPHSPLIEPYDTGTAGSRLSRQPRSQSTRPDRAP